MAFAPRRLREQTSDAPAARATANPSHRHRIACRSSVFVAAFIYALTITSGDNGIIAISFAKAQDRQFAIFDICVGAARINCVVDGDTFWLDGTKIRITDIDAPEISQPACAAERRAGEIARQRLLVLLNNGAFSLRAGARDEDRYGRKLRIVERDHRSLGDMLIEEGLARRWNGPERNWCSTG
ncbi:thermonuclease family protein (plasmid) [Agrobacterium vitis]|nr:thermonuclease family protein [Agrobacterium tumefaciens]NSZ19751.1 thermonuclease family protein [Agrobacterium vitis]QZO06993.1 thermonuclease family protein [Agrobacterium vitis]UJL91480.1 thermonuclease family protein [Agrobacterium vitis]